jgi:hypothetical protein
MLVPPAILLLSLLSAWAQLTLFYRSTPTIRNDQDLVRYRKLATVQMYFGLLSPLIWLPAIVWLYGFFVAGELGWMDLLLYVAVPIFVLSIVAIAFGGPAKEVQSITAATPALQAECKRIADIWLHKKLPRF